MIETAMTIESGLLDQADAFRELLRMLADTDKAVADGLVAPVQTTFDDIRQQLLARQKG